MKHNTYSLKLMEKKILSGLDRQREIYIQGISGKKPLLPVGFAQLEAKAQTKMNPEAFAYIAGGAGTEHTVDANREAFEQWLILPRVLVDVSDRSMGITLFGETFPSPIMLAPIGVLELAHPKGDLAVAEAAAATGVPMIFSNQASFSMEECSSKMGESVKWFQLYWSKSDKLVASLVSRAEACGCKAIVVTLDTFMLGWRTRDLDLAYLPFLEGRGIAQYVSDPVFLELLEKEMTQPNLGPKPSLTLKTLKTLYQMTRHFPGSFMKNLQSGKPKAAVRLFTNIYSRQSLTWENLAFLRTVTKLPILLKGILHPDDARKAQGYGLDGIIVSTHGGRQLDGSIGALDALPGIIQATGNNYPVLLDSGIRGGADIFKALALGAKAVLVGRPYAYGLALAGKEGVIEIIKNLTADFDITMSLAGCSSIKEINSSLLTKIG